MMRHFSTHDCHTGVKKWSIMFLKVERDCTLKIRRSCFVSVGGSADSFLLREPFQVKHEPTWFQHFCSSVCPGGAENIRKANPRLCRPEDESVLGTDSFSVLFFVLETRKEKIPAELWAASCWTWCGGTDSSGEIHVDQESSAHGRRFCQAASFCQKLLPDRKRVAITEG